MTLTLLLTLALLPGCAVIDPRQTDPPPPGIARIETVTIDGLPERLLIRGRDPIHNPLLLFIHGGPGFPGAIFRQVNSDLERDFTVVHWDQRGAGYSFLPGIPLDTMRVEQFVRETLIVSRYLCREFHQPKLYLVGHSWGTLPAILAAARHPELYYPYVAISQLVDVDESERRLTRAALRHAHDEGARKLARELKAAGPPPYWDLTDQDRAAGLISALFPRVPHQATDLRLIVLALWSRYYPLPEILHSYHSYRYSRRLLDPQLHGYDLRQLVPELDTPVYFFVGRVDTIFGVTLQQEYWRELIAPRGKQFVLFRDSTHWPYLEQPADYATQLRRVRAQTWKPSRHRTSPEGPMTAPEPGKQKAPVAGSFAKPR
jgi:pimeloyl-ACP methyl ester carboxylesterase